MPRARISQAAPGGMAEILPLTPTTAADLRVPDAPQGVVVVASEESAGGDIVRDALHEARFATLRLKRRVADSTIPPGAYVRILAEELLSAADWLRGQRQLTGLLVGIFGTLEGGGAALAAAARRPDVFRALVLRDGGPHAAGIAVHGVSAATLLIVGGQDSEVVALNQETMARVLGIAELEILPPVPTDSDDPGATAQVAHLASRWFNRFLS